MSVEWQSAAQSLEWPVCSGTSPWRGCGARVPVGHASPPSKGQQDTRDDLRASFSPLRAGAAATMLTGGPPSLLWSQPGPPGCRETGQDVSQRPSQDGLIRLALLTYYNLSPRLPEGLLPTRHWSRELCLGSSPSHSPWESVYTV